MNLDSCFLSRTSCTFSPSSKRIASKFIPNFQKVKRNNKLVRGNKREKQSKLEVRQGVTSVSSGVTGLCSSV